VISSPVARVSCIRWCSRNFAFVAGAVGHHQHAAFGAGGGVFESVSGRIGPRFNGGRRSQYRSLRRGRRNGSDNGAFHRSAIELQIIRGDEAPAKPARDVIEHGSGEADVGVGSDAAGFEAGVDQLVDKDLQRHAVLQADGECEREAVHDAG